ncbi:TRAP transporter substrate-binding protein [Marinomonas agarivorans]|nr:TRAP transporter substrate-binding protein [Marinomonas agarivorans]
MPIKQLHKWTGIALLSTMLMACNSNDNANTSANGTSFDPVVWKMVTAWPKNFPGVGTGAEKLAQNITTMSGGRIKVTVYGAGELVPPLEVFDAVSRGTAELGHGAAYYWKGKVPAAQFFTSVPFGLTAQEMNAWIYHGGGLELWEEVYAPFNVIPMAAGNNGVQMAGWFNKEIKSIEDFSGLKMRIPGLGGEVLKKVGGVPVNLPGGEIFTALQTGTIDATEFAGPYNDLAFGFYKVAKYYYYPGWHEPGSVSELIVNKTAFESLPADLQSIVRAATRQTNGDMLEEYTSLNNDALEILVRDYDVELRALPSDVMQVLQQTAEEILLEVAQEDVMSQKVYDSFVQFRSKVSAWHSISEHAYIKARDGR